MAIGFKVQSVNHKLATNWSGVPLQLGRFRVNWTLGKLTEGRFIATQSPGIGICDLQALGNDQCLVQDQVRLRQQLPLVSLVL